MSQVVLQGVRREVQIGSKMYYLGGSSQNTAKHQSCICTILMMCKFLSFSIRNNLPKILPFCQTFQMQEMSSCTAHNLKHFRQNKRSGWLVLGDTFGCVLEPLGRDPYNHQSKDIFEILQTVIHKCGVFLALPQHSSIKTGAFQKLSKIAYQ